MCTLVYIASDTPVPVKPWDPSQPSFHVRHIDDIEHARIRHFTAKPNLYYVETREKCGCPFSYGATPGVDDSPTELAAQAKALRSLQSLLEGALSSSLTVELLAFEAEDWKGPVQRRRINVDDLSARSFAFTP